MKDNVFQYLVLSH